MPIENVYMDKLIHSHTDRHAQRHLRGQAHKDADAHPPSQPTPGNSCIAGAHNASRPTPGRVFLHVPTWRRVAVDTNYRSSPPNTELGGT